MNTSHDLPFAASAERIALLLLTAAAMVTAIAVVWLFDPLKINPDTMQLIDTARHLVAGQGLTSGIVYYDAQRAFEQVPAPMIIWPPGFPWLLAAGMNIGLTAETTALASCLAAHIATTFLIYFGLRRVGASAAVAAVVGLVWLAHPTALSLTISCFAEPIYTAFTLASMLTLIKALSAPPRWRVWLIASGVFAALAVLMRYTGVLWPAAAGLWLAFLAVRQRSWRPIGTAIAFGALPAITTITLFWRNYALNGELSGGQFDYGGSAGVGEVLRRFYWGTDLLFGSRLTAHPLVLGAVFAVLGIGIAQLALTLRSSEPRGLLVGLSLTKTILLAVFLFINALRSSIVFVDYRYWMPAMPFMLMVIGLVADSAVSKLRAAPAPRTKLWRGVVTLSSAALAVSIFIAVASGWPYTQPHPATQLIAHALTEKLPDGRPLASVLSGSADSPHLLLSNEERRLGYVADVAVVGLPIARYTQHVWTSDTVAGVVSKFNISHVLFFPSTYEAEFKNPFYEALRAGKLPDWLTVQYRGERFVLYAVVPDKLAR